MANNDQFGRGLKLTVGGVVVETSSTGRGLRVAFDISRDKRLEPNSATISIWGLNSDTRGSLTSEGVGNTVRLEVGYADDLQQIFFGVLSKTEVVREGPDLITTVMSGDGSGKLVTSRVTKSFAKGTPTGSVLTELANALGLESGNVGSFTGSGYSTFGNTLQHALTINGPAAEELQIFCNSLGLEYSIQNGALQVTEKDGGLAGTGPLISPTSGLIGSPEIGNDGNVLGTALMLPDLLPGVPFQVESSQINGTFIAKATKHYGDTHDQSWYVDFQGAPI